MSTLVLDQVAPVFPVQKSPPELKLLTSQQIANTYYEGKPTATGKGYKIYTDDPILDKEIEEVQLYKSRFSKKIGDTDLVLFASKNGAFLLQRYLEAVPQSKELILFLEIDDKYNTNTVLRAVAGSDLTKKDSEFADILSFVRKQEVTITPKVLKKLIEEGIYRNKVSFISWFLGLKDAAVSKIFNFYTQGILSAAADYFKKDIAGDIASWRIPENGWNPEKENYEPALIPEAVYKELKRYFEHTDSPNNPYVGLEGQKKVITKIVSSLFEKIDSAKKYFLGILDQAMTLKFFPELLFKKIKHSVSRFFTQFDKIEKYLKNPTTGIQAMVYKGFQTANALLCGIYNSFIDIIAGLFSLIGFLFEAVAAMADVGASKADYGEMFLELMENMMEGIFSFDYADFIIRWISFEIRTVIKMANWVLENVTGVSLESIAYYFGYIVGLIIDIIVETLITGGTAAVAKLLESTAAFIKNPLAKVEAGINKIAGVTKKLLDRLIDFITFISAKLKKGSEALFKDLNKFIDEVFGFGEEVADNALTPAEKRFRDKKKAQAERLERKKNGGYLSGDDEEIFRKVQKGAGGGQRYRRSTLRQIAKSIEEKYVDINLKVEIVTKRSHPERYKRWTSYPNDILASCRTHEIPPIMFLRDDATELTIQHEMWHIDDFKKYGFEGFNSLPNWTAEELVWERVWKQKHRWTQEELIDSYKYYKESCGREGAEYKIIEELEKISK
ncbi:zincin-like metallopeptidase toxin domain-containing protein [Epilithonimonas sp.]|uniref:zincin-like metallopeptidase toxin domain-containing protein n=1 Tax=Epilithonimonas sp. TaxID=2894511 RepID=UPI00289D9798|nr:zincin-like metallopeptidase toxin domain-containing protein [Epilithonimonas sp.]